MIKGILIDLGDTLIEQKVDAEAPLSELQLVAFPDATPALSELKARGYQIALVSNTFQSRANDVASALEKLGLLQFVDAIVTSSDVGVEKPDPRMFLAAVERLQLQTDAVVMIGDDIEKDIRGASQLGIAAVLVQRRSTKVDSMPAGSSVVGSLLDIPTLIDSLNEPELRELNVPAATQMTPPQSYERLARSAQDQLLWNEAARYYIKSAEYHLYRNEYEKAASEFVRAARCREQGENWREIGGLWVRALAALSQSSRAGESHKSYEDYDASTHYFMGIDPDVWDGLPIEERIGRAFRYAGYHLEKAGTNQSAYNQYFSAGMAFERVEDWEQAGRAFYLATISFVRQFGELNQEHLKHLEAANQRGMLNDESKYLHRMRLYYRRISAELRRQGNEEDQEALHVKQQEISRVLAFKRRVVQRWLVLSIWKLTSNYGTDLPRWLAWTVTLAFGVFPALYKVFDLLTPQPYSWADSLYFSIAAFVTLSYLDFSPIGWGRIVALSEIAIGLVMLGSLLTMIINKFIRA